MAATPVARAQDSLEPTIGVQYVVYVPGLGVLQVGLKESLLLSARLAV